MKRPTSGLSVGLWVAGGLVGLYVIGFFTHYLDGRILKTYYFMKLPREVLAVLAFAYDRLFEMIP